MFCEQCGSQIPEASKFCISCGSAVASVGTPARTMVTASPSQTATAQAVQMSPIPQEIQSTQPSAEGQPASGTSRHGAAWILVMFIVVVGVIFAVLATTSSPAGQKSSSNSLRQLATAPLIRTYTSNLPQANFPVPAGRYQYFRFNVPLRSSNVHIDGHFEAAGGSGNDIEVVVLSAEEFADWSNNQETQAYYVSGQITRDTLNVKLPPTTDAPVTYYLVFTNVFSVLSNKRVTSDIKLHYDRVL